jgi:hypothetical protein
MRHTIMRWSLYCLFWALFESVGSAQEVQSLLIRIKAVGKEGSGNIEAARAWKELVAQGPGVLTDILAGMDDANPIAINWLRGGVEAIQDKASRTAQKIPADKIEAFLRDTRHAGHSRRLAYECLVRADPTTPARLLPKMLDDPTSELRRDAVAVKLEQGLSTSFENAASRTEYFRDLLKYARDRDQINAICAELKKQGIEVDQTKHYGFVTRWLLAGPFDNVGGVGFSNVYPPERGIDVEAVYAGKGNQQVRWREHTTDKPLGLVDVNEAVGKLKGAVAYAHAVVSAETKRPIEIRAASNNAVRIWLNGKEIYFREEYHHGMEMDQHVGKGVLQAGRNEILIKVCQNEQTDSWAQLWSFQLRICDYLGAAVPVTNVTPKAK